MARFEVGTREYRLTHGGKPRGQGLWMFKNARTHELFEAQYGTLTDAKNELRRYVAADRKSRDGNWSVCP